ncbi:hypothetical protein IKD57_01515 [Candidatus Saccharibacteria bacterium]|nr:hypothetical protein [Candidatus Saccharibacteria bacterium]
MIDLKTMIFEDGGGLVYADFLNNPLGVLGTLESAKNELLSIPNGDKTQEKTIFSIISMVDGDRKPHIIIKDRSGLNICWLTVEEDETEEFGKAFRVDSIQVELKHWNAFVDILRKEEVISEKEAIILSI